MAFWGAKLKGNRIRDAATRRQLRKLGWKVLVIWECQTKDLVNLGERLSAFLEALE